MQNALVKSRKAFSHLSRKGMLVNYMGCFTKQLWRMHGEHAAPDRLADVDIDAEYELIRQKKSKLPRALRDRIVQAKESA